MAQTDLANIIPLAPDNYLLYFIRSIYRFEDEDYAGSLDDLNTILDASNIEPRPALSGNGNHWIDLKDVKANSLKLQGPVEDWKQLLRSTHVRQALIYHVLDRNTEYDAAIDEAGASGANTLAVRDDIKKLRHDIH